VSELAKDKSLGLSAALSYYGSRMDLPSLSALSVPTAFIFGGADGGIPQPDTANAINGLAKTIAVPISVLVVDGVPHGFAHRFDTADPNAVKASTTAINAGVEWLKTHAK
jgi:fermentation-respiration switch protein FrsA (DUF1100 family)